MRKLIITGIVGVGLLSGCMSTPDANIVSASPAGISVKSKLVADWGDATLLRDQKMAATAQLHCETYGKNAIQTIRERDGSYVNSTYSCS